jgi:serine-type D-Ala-D-Ala carboxypeptidase (penicillin-binding protein 5/6)
MRSKIFDLFGFSTSAIFLKYLLWLALIFVQPLAYADNNLSKLADNLYDLMGKSNVSKGVVADTASSTNASSSNVSENTDVDKTIELNTKIDNNPKDAFAFKNFDKGLKLPELNLSAHAWVLYDMNTQQILNTYETKKSIPLSEFNQLMLLYLVFEAMADQKLHILEKYNIKSIEEKMKQLPFDAPKMLLNVKETIDLQALIKGMIYTKGFDAAQALVYLLNPSYLENSDALINKMNDKSKQLGLKDTTFKYFAPLLNSNQSTERTNQGTSNVNDLLILVKRLHYDFPQFMYLFDNNQLVYEKNTISNQNNLNVLQNINQDNQVIQGFYKQSSLKTGLILRVKKTEKSLERQERFLFGIIIHTQDQVLLEEDSLKMMNYGLAEFDTIKVYRANDVLSQQKLWMGQQNTLKVGVLKDAYISLPKNMTSRLNTILDKPKFLYAPIEKGQLIGHIRYLHQNKEVANIPVVSLENVDEAFFIKRLWHMVLAWFE